MKITLYKSSLCPRCYLAKKHLQAITSGQTDVEIEEVDILLSPGRAWSDGVRMIPTLKIGNELLTGVIVKREAIEDFINNNIKNSEH